MDLMERKYVITPGGKEQEVIQHRLQRRWERFSQRWRRKRRINMELSAADFLTIKTEMFLDCQFSLKMNLLFDCLQINNSLPHTQLFSMQKTYLSAELNKKNHASLYKLG